MTTTRYEIDPETGEMKLMDGTIIPRSNVTLPFVRTPYNYDMNEASNETAISCPEPTLAQQHDVESTDINVIVERFGLTGQLPQDVRTPLNVDFVETVDMKTAMDQMVKAQAAFMEMPAKTRARFGNDPALFVDFVSDENNRDEARKMGLLVPEKPAQAPMEVRVIPDPPKA